jgi:hypothetical protein
LHCDGSFSESLFEQEVAMQLLPNSNSQAIMLNLRFTYPAPVHDKLSIHQLVRQGPETWLEVFAPAPWQDVALLEVADFLAPVTLGRPIASLWAELVAFAED